MGPVHMVLALAVELKSFALLAVALVRIALVLAAELKRDSAAVNFLSHTSMAYNPLPGWRIWHSMGETGKLDNSQDEEFILEEIISVIALKVNIIYSSQLRL